MERPERNQCILYKDTKNTQWGKESHFNKWGWESWVSTSKMMKLDLNLTPQQKSTQTGLKTNARIETKTPRRKIGENFKTLVLMMASEYNTKKHRKQKQKYTIYTHDVVQTKKLMHSKEKQSTE